MEAKTPEDVYKMHLVEGRAPTGEGLGLGRERWAAGASVLHWINRLID